MKYFTFCFIDVDIDNILICEQEKKMKSDLEIC